MKKYLFVVIGLMFLTLQCETKEKGYSFKRAELNSGAKELIDKYLKYSNIPKALNQISIDSYQYEGNTIYTINTGRLLSSAVNSYKTEKFYSTDYKGYFIFIKPKLRDKLFSEDGIIVIEQNKVEVIDKDNFIPYPDDIISNWEFEIKGNKLINLKYQFCVLSEEQIKNIESIDFGNGTD